MRRHGVTQPSVTWAWRRLHDVLQPDLLYDVGANYGEISLGCIYESNQMLFLIEPNPNVLHYLRKSVAGHPTRGQIKIIDKVLFDKSGTIEFVVDEKWSGTSSTVVPITDDVFKGPGEQTCTPLHVPCVTLDELTDSYGGSPTSILIKLDIEGAELSALKGAERTLRLIRKFAILLEYNRQTLHQDSYPDEDLWNIIKSLGEVYSICAGEHPHLVGSETELGQKVDLIVVPRGEVAERFASDRAPYVLRWCG